jgi:hypothetical protein
MAPVGPRRSNGCCLLVRIAESPVWRWMTLYDDRLGRDGVVRPTVLPVAGSSSTRPCRAHRTCSSGCRAKEDSAVCSGTPSRTRRASRHLASGRHEVTCDRGETHTRRDLRRCACCCGRRCRRPVLQAPLLATSAEQRRYRPGFRRLLPSFPIRFRGQAGMKGAQFAGKVPPCATGGASESRRDDVEERVKRISPRAARRELSRVSVKH